MVDIDEVVAKILRQRAVLPEARSLLVGVSGIDGSGKGTRGTVMLFEFTASVVDRALTVMDDSMDSISAGTVGVSTPWSTKDLSP
jgi:pantothenate kinase-related protein Tda10